MLKAWLRFPLAIIALIIAGQVLVSCGGGAVITPAADDTTPVVTTPDNILPLGSPLPAIPTGLEDVAADSTSRSTSAILDYPGADFLVASGATPDGDNLILQSTEEDVAWAMYKAEDLAGLRITKFAIETIPGSPDTEYSVGLSNYDSGYWEYYITTQLPEAEIDLSEETTRLISSLGNCYWVVIVWGGESLTILESHLFTEDDPGTPGDPDDYPCPMMGEIDSMAADHFMLWSYDPGINPPGNRDPMGDDGFLYQIDFNADTMWFDEDGTETGPEAFAAGDEVFADVLISGETMLAILVQKLGDPGPGDPWVGLEGEIATIGDGLITLTSGEACNYDDDTEWWPMEGPGTPADLAPGDWVFIDAIEVDTGMGLLALLVMEMPNDPGDPDRDVWPIDGEIVAFDDSSMEIAWDGQVTVVLWDSETVWLTEDGEGGPEDFAVGDFVHIDALQNCFGWLALLVMDMGAPGDPGTDPLVFIGEIVALTDSTITLFDGMVIEYDEGTLWFDEEMGPIGSDDVEIGDVVYIEAMLKDNGVPLALTVYVLGDRDPGIW